MPATARAVALALTLVAGVARGQVPEDPKELPPLALGPIPRFASDAVARQNCLGDIPVWADDDTGFFYPAAHPKYGRTAHGAFTCLREATRADYWNINPFVGDPERGRVFPIDPSLLSDGA